MKLRNKKTGEIAVIGEGMFDTRYFGRGYKNIGELLEEWEDYQTVKPLIKDEKVRKAVRAWAEANDFERLEVTHSRKHTLRVMDEKQDVEIFFFRKDGMPEIDERVYPLSELCGEED